VGGLITYFILTFVYYWWHRWRHDINFLWLTMHQVHHSPQRIETITSFFKHPLEIVANSLITGAVTYVLLGMPVEAAAWSMVFQAWGEFFYHMNIKTPRWVGYFFQRPEMHRIHHERGKHYSNFSDLPIWDMMFGTYKNPDTYQGLCGFKPEREARLGAMLAFQNVNNPYPPKPVEGDK
jgi:sterol desaturase/sphingolipid hydroxylase (fatty acid hydroxylase superfamily)